MKTVEKISVKEKFSYGLGDTASNLFFMTFVYFLSYFYTDVFGISAAAAGTMFALTRLWDGINDPLMGLIADRTETRWGKFRPYLLWMAFPLGIIGVLTFTSPNLNATGKIVYAYVTYALMMMIYTAINIPYSSLMGVVSSSSKVRTVFSQYRFVLAFVGGLIVQGTMLPLVGYFGGGDTSAIDASITPTHQLIITEQGKGTAKLEISIQREDGKSDKKEQTIWVNTPEILAEGDTNVGILYLESGFGQKEFELNKLFPDVDWNNVICKINVINEKKGFQLTMAVFSSLAIVLFLITFYNTKERVHPPIKQRTSLKNDIGDLLKNRPWVILFFVGIFTLTYTCLRNGSIMYYFKYYIENKNLATIFMLTGTFATMVSIVGIGWISNRFGKKKTYIGCMLLTSLLTTVYFFVPSNQIVLIFILQIAVNLAFGPTCVLVFAMYTDAADYSEWKTGRRATGLVMSASTMSQKFGMVIGGASIGWLLAAFGFVANVQQTPETINGIRIIFSWIPAISSLIGAILMFFYILDEKTMEKIESDLKSRRKEDYNSLSH